jgi:hypothetical protein
LQANKTRAAKKMLLTNNVPEFLSSAGAGRKDLHRAGDLAAKAIRFHAIPPESTESMVYAATAADKRGL